MNQTLETLHSLRTNHGHFSDQEVSEEDLTTIIEAATRAASSSARQPYSVIVLDDRDTMHSLVGYRASRALVFCIDFRRLEFLAARLDRFYDNDDIVGFVTASIDTSLAAQTAVIAARSLGIDSLITNGLHRNKCELVFRELAIPETSVFPLITIMLGYPSGEDHGTRGRLPIDVVSHRGRYRDLSEGEIDDLIAAHDDPELRLGMDSAWDPKVHAHYLEWFIDQWTGKPSATRIPEGKLKEIQDRLVKSGFWWPES